MLKIKLKPKSTETDRMCLAPRLLIRPFEKVGFHLVLKTASRRRKPHLAWQRIP